MERELVDFYERCFITITSVMDYKSWRLDENKLCFPSTSRTYSTTVNKMFGCAIEHSNLCVLSMDCVLITNIFSYVRLVKL